MESEKVKEIKKALECNATDKHNNLSYIDENDKCKLMPFADILNLINELESENEWLVNKVKEKVNEMTTYTVNNQKLKDRIVELEKENESLKNRITFKIVFPDEKLEKIKKQCIENVYADVKDTLKQFAERLKEKAVDWDCETVNCIINAIDKTLKEFIND